MSARRRFRDDPELVRTPSIREQCADLPLLNPGAWPESPPATDEQRVIPMHGTIESAYQAWRQTTEGEAVFRAFCREAVTQVAAGAARLSGKGIAETIRFRMRREINNSHIALMVRDCEDAHPSARLFEKRVRRAS